MSDIPSQDIDRMYRRKDASTFLRDTFGIPCAPQTLAKLIVIGGGPEVRYYGRTPLYPETALRRWAASKIKTARSTSDRGDQPASAAA